MPTVAEVLTEVRNILNEATAAQWDDAMLRQWITEGNRDLARSTRYYKGTQSIVLTAGTAEYAVGTSILAIEHAYYNDGSRDMPLLAKHYEQMDNIWGQYSGVNGWPQFFTTIGSQPTLKVRLYPVPSINGHTLKLVTAVIPVEVPLASPTSTAIEVPAAWYDALADYCEYKARRRDGDPAWTSAFEVYRVKRDQLLEAPDHLAINREIVPTPNGYMPSWLVEFDTPW